MRFLITLLLVACAGAPATPEPAPEPTAEKGGGHGDHGHAATDPMVMKKAPEGAKVSFVEPADGATVSSPLKVVMAVEGMEVRPAGELVDGTGHHHLLIDTEPVAWGVAVPADEKHIHFGKGQTEAEVELQPGEHVLMLQFADGVHRSYGEGLMAKITVTVK